MNSELGNGFWKIFVDSTSPRLLIKITEKQKVSGFSCFVSIEDGFACYNGQKQNRGTASSGKPAKSFSLHF